MKNHPYQQLNYFLTSKTSLTKMDIDILELFDARVIVFDCETLGADSTAITQIGAVEIVCGRLTDKNYLRAVKQYGILTPEQQRVIERRKNAMLNADEFSVVWPDFFDFIIDSEQIHEMPLFLASHNARFDRRVLKGAIASLGDSYNPSFSKLEKACGGRFIDTLTLAKKHLKSQGSNKLDWWFQFHRIKRKNPHCPLQDSEMSARILEQVLQKEQSKIRYSIDDTKHPDFSSSTQSSISNLNTRQQNSNNSAKICGTNLSIIIGVIVVVLILVFTLS